MKRADLEKMQGKKVVEEMRRSPARDRFGAASSQPQDRREQRRREAAAGLVPFAVKLPERLVAELQARARTRGTGLNELAEELLRKALGDAGADRKAGKR